MSSERAQLWMFHFRCPLCGSAPGAVPLRSYLEGWRIADRAMVADLLENTSASLLEVFDRTGGWPTKKVKRELERFWSASESFSGRAHSESRHRSLDPAFDAELSPPFVNDEENIRRQDLLWSFRERSSGGSRGVAEQSRDVLKRSRGPLVKLIDRRAPAGLVSVRIDADVD